MGAGILPIALHKGKLYFLFGKENKYADTPGWSDFGGGIDKGETPLNTAIREAQEEITGFLGDDKDIKKMMKQGTFNIVHNDYHMYICLMPYNDYLPLYYNNNQRFLQKKLDPKIIETSKIFEKSEIKWVSADALMKMRPQFRSYFKEFVDILSQKKVEIMKFAKKGENKTRKNKN